MILRKRKGMALITVVLIAALFLISIVGISAKVISEKKVSNARASSERALVTSETGLSQVLFNLRNTDFTDPGSTAPPGNLEYLTVGGARNIASNDPGYVLPLSEHSYSESTDKPYVTYRVKIKKTDGGTWDPDNPSDVPIEVSLAIYSLGTVYSDSSKAEVLARRVISTECKAVFSRGASSSLIDYGILAGGDIDFFGNSQESGGDIFTNGSITSHGQGPDGLRVDGGIAYAVDSAPDGIASEGEVEGVVPIDIPSLFADYTKGLAWSFKTGQYPYDGTEEDYPNTSPEDGIVAAVISSYLSGDEETGDTLGDIHDFYNDLMGYGVEGYVPADPDKFDNFGTLSSDQLFDLRDNAKNIAYYQKGDITITNSTLNNLNLSQYEKDNNLINLRGIVVMEGDFTIKSNVAIGDPNNYQFALIIREDDDGNGGVITAANGTATIYGLIYAENAINMTAGTLDCYGALATNGNITLRGTSKVYYHNTGLNTAGALEYDLNGIESANIGPSSWKEISYEEFSSP